MGDGSYNANLITPDDTNVVLLINVLRKQADSYSRHLANTLLREQPANVTERSATITTGELIRI